MLIEPKVTIFSGQSFTGLVEKHKHERGILSVFEKPKICIMDFPEFHGLGFPEFHRIPPIDYHPLLKFIEDTEKHLDNNGNYIANDGSVCELKYCIKRDSDYDLLTDPFPKEYLGLQYVSVTQRPGNREFPEELREYLANNSFEDNGAPRGNYQFFPWNKAKQLVKI